MVTTLELSGRVFSLDDVECLEYEIEEGVEGAESIQIGDVRIWPCEGGRGEANRRGRHTNWGYSGYLRSSVFDGERWRDLDLRTICLADEQNFRFKYELPQAIQRVRETIRQNAGTVVEYKQGSGKRRRFAADLLPLENQ